jgi:hypothetical protein
MPMSAWSEVAGKPCQICGGYATHYYGDMIICCDCHVGEKDTGLYTQEQARDEHYKYLKKELEGEAQ